jgi:protein KTI12
VQRSLRDQIYNSAKEEKTARAEEFSAIKRVLSKDVIVIADGLNYIKGYRYQLWCEAKAAGTRCCVVHVAAREDECKAWNNERLKAAGREDEVDEGGPQGAATQSTNGIEEMLPESHTAIYGDRIVVPASRSRSSSMDGASDDDERRKLDDTMTLKSLYLRDRTVEKGQEEAQRSIPEVIPPESKPEATPAIPPPPPSSSPPFNPSTLKSLCMRYEPPSPFSRWDTPLFTVPTTDTHAPYAAIWDALFPAPVKHLSKKALSQQSQGTLPPRPDEIAVKQHAATVLPAATDASALQILESSTQLVTTALLAAYRASALEGEGGTLSFSVDGTGCEIDVPPGLVVSQPMLQRLRRKYTGLQRGGIAHGVGSVQGGRRGVVEGFVGFLGREWSGDV